MINFSIFSFLLQQLFRSQNPSLASNAGVAPPGQQAAQQQIPQTLPLPSQQYLAQQSAAYAAAAQQPAPYVINPGQDAARYIGKSIALDAINYGQWQTETKYVKTHPFVVSSSQKWVLYQLVCHNITALRRGICIQPT